MQLIMQSILLFLLFSFFQVIWSQNYGTQQFVNDPYKMNTGIFNFNNILRNGLATGMSTLETGSNILQLPLKVATNLFQYAPESTSNQQLEQLNDNPYNSYPSNSYINPIQQGINTATSNLNNNMGAGLTSGINALESGASTLQLPLQAATNLFQYAPESTSNQQLEQLNDNPYNSYPSNGYINPIQQGINTATSNLNNNMGAGLTSGINALESGASTLQLPLQAATNLFQYAPESTSNQQLEQLNDIPYNSYPSNGYINLIEQGINTATSNLNNNMGAGLTSGINALESGASILQLPLQTATNLFQYAPESTSNQQPGQYDKNPYNSNPSPIQQGINTATSNLNNNMGAGLTSGITALGAGADILNQQLKKATNIVQNIPEFTSNGINFIQNVGQTGRDMANSAVELSTTPIVDKLKKFGYVLGRFSSYSDPQYQIDQSNNIKVPSISYNNRYQTTFS